MDFSRDEEHLAIQAEKLLNVETLMELITSDVEFNENEIYVLGADMTVGRPQPVKGAVLKPAKVKRTGTFREGKEQRFAQMNPANTLVRSELNSSEEIKTRDGRAGRPHYGG